MVTEEDMSKYLEQLRLAARDSDEKQQQHQQQQTALLHSVVGDTWAEDQRSFGGTALKQNPGSRKRRLDIEGEAMMDYDEDVTTNDSISVSLWKPAGDSSQVKRVRLDGVSSLPALENPSTETNQVHLNQEDAPCLVLCGGTSPTLVAPCVGTQRSSISEMCVSDSKGKEEDSAESSKDEQDGGEEAALSGKVWIAPEVQQLCMNKQLLPSAVLNEM